MATADQGAPRCVRGSRSVCKIDELRIGLLGAAIGAGTARLPRVGRDQIKNGRTPGLDNAEPAPTMAGELSAAWACPIRAHSRRASPAQTVQPGSSELR